MRDLPDLIQGLQLLSKHTQLTLAVLAKPQIGSIGCPLFSDAYAFWKQQYAAIYADGGGKLEQNSDGFLCMDKIVLLYDNDGIVALCALQFFDLQNLAHLECSQILRCGQDWVSDKIKNGARSICYGSKLVSDRNHSVHRIHKFRSLGSLYAVLMFRHFQETGLDLAVCVTRRDRGMTSAATLVGGHQEREVEIEGVEYLDLDLMVANQQDAAAFPFQRMGPAFDSLWQGRRSTWEEVVADGLVIKVHEL